MPRWIDWRVGKPPKNRQDCVCGHPKKTHKRSGSPTVYGACNDIRCACDRYQILVGALGEATRT